VTGVAGTKQEGSLLYPIPPPAPGTPGGDPVAAVPVAEPGGAGLVLPIAGGAAVAAAIVVGLLTGVF